MNLEHPKTIKWFSLASVITISISFIIYYYNANTSKLTKDEQQAVILYNQTKVVLDSISMHLNKGQKSLLEVKEYAQVKEKIFKK